MGGFLNGYLDTVCMGVSVTKIGRDAKMNGSWAGEMVQLVMFIGQTFYQVWL